MPRKNITYVDFQKLLISFQDQSLVSDEESLANAPSNGEPEVTSVNVVF